MNNSKIDFKIKFIGDSHSVLTFGQTVLSHLEKYFDVHFLAFSGLKLQNMCQWHLKKNELIILNFEKKRGHDGVFSKDPLALGNSFTVNASDILVVALGTNDIVECGSRSQAYETIKKNIEDQFNSIPTRTIIFIEPPTLAVDADGKIRHALTEHMSTLGVKVISSQTFYADQNDGIHMKKQMALAFGEDVSKKLLKLILPHH